MRNLHLLIGAAFLFGASFSIVTKVVPRFFEPPHYASVTDEWIVSK